MHKVAREDVLSRHAPILIEQLPAPPSVLGRSSDGDDIARLEIEFFRYRCRVIVKCAHCIDIDVDRSTKKKHKVTKNKLSVYILPLEQKKRTVEKHGLSGLRILPCGRLRQSLRLRVGECHRLRRRTPVHRTRTERPVSAGASIRDVLVLLVLLLILLPLLLGRLRVHLVLRRVIVSTT